MRKWLIILLTCLCFLIFFDSNSIGKVITFVWDCEAGATGYKLYTGTKTRTYTSSVDVGNVCTYPMTVPDDGILKFYAATAYDKSKIESDYSNEVTYTAQGTVTFAIPQVNPKVTK